METTTSRKRAIEAGTSCKWSNMERPSRSRENVHGVSLACVSCVDGRNTSDGDRCVHGDNRILLK
jgi:hypothetical protein